MKHPVLDNIHSYNNGVSRFTKNSMKSHCNHIGFLYEGAIEPYEDAADYANLGAVVKAVRIA